ncbi:MAG TPA: MFS transporter [Candidatus Binatia bacterium]|nr:MFS transporter [Candidatus Binatia bacterium]
MISRLRTSRDASQPALEPILRSPTPTTDEQEAEAPGVAGAKEATSSQSWRFLHALRRFRILDALHHRQFRLIWYGQIFSAMATWMDQVARGWLIYELTDSALQLGLVRGVQAIPILLLGPLAGSTADRYSRKVQVLVAQLVDGLLYGTIAILIFAGQIEPWHVYVTAFGMSIVWTFQQPSRAAMVADAVPLNQLTNAVGLNSIVFNVARSVGPALAGFLIAFCGTAGSYTAQAIFYFLATIWTVQLRSDQPPRVRLHGDLAHQESLGRSIIEGWKFSWQNEAVRASLLIVVFASLFIIPFMTLLPVFARDILQVGANGQGLLLSAMGVGALFSSVLLASFGDRLPRMNLMLGGVTLYGIIIVAFAASPWFELSVVLMVSVGIVHVTSHALAQTVIQTYSPAEFRGRTMAMFHMTHVVLLVGGILIGALSSLIGAQWAAASMSIAGALAVLSIYWFMPQARLIR